MSTPLMDAPEKSAHTSDWLAWLKELSTMPETVEVRKALVEARNVLSHRRHKQVKPMHTPSPFGRHAY